MRNKPLRLIMLFKLNRRWSFHVIVLQVTGKKCIKIKNTRAEQIVLFIKLFLATLSLSSPPWFAKALKKFSELTSKETERNILIGK